MILVYSKVRHGHLPLSKHFKVDEFACRDGSDEILVDSKLVELLEIGREFFGKPILIRSGYRTPAYNATLEGASQKSQHMQGRAADIVVPGVDLDRVWAWADTHNSQGGVGLYNTFVHIDVRVEGRARWDNRT